MLRLIMGKRKRLRGREFNKELVSFGECVWYMKPKNKHLKKGDYRWGTGIRMAIRDESGEYSRPIRQSAIIVTS